MNIVQAIDIQKIECELSGAKTTLIEQLDKAEESDRVLEVAGRRRTKITRNTYIVESTEVLQLQIPWEMEKRKRLAIEVVAKRASSDNNYKNIEEI
ncbi:4973_t:CDS:2 [Diversispora eburnea]|uniref:4973_t:CDS:1 n=1 Tax=Diversispora eburnea TaxID=1213867 RepID=A0A9N8VET5_9GLOM|nr:4973_t:CDS:2 [Diversispora eburnea]